MNSERIRRRTFQNWPTIAPVDSQRIARAGFYYTGHGLNVQCFSCGGTISEWQFGDKVMAKHRLLDPRCPFVLNPAASGNVPLTDIEDQTSSEGTSHQNASIEDDLNDKNKYKSEAARLDTFSSWPISSIVEGYRLAKAGFYYLQELDKVKCAFCGIAAYNWEAGDDPIEEHGRHSPTCPFLSSISVSCTSQNSDNVIVLRENYFNFKTEYEGLAAHQMKDFGILNHRIPKHSKFMTEEARISSYEKWPKRDIKDPIELAKAGFYYTGVEDKVRCYHCGGGLQKWKENDDPWIEHIKWFSECDFVCLIKGDDFISEVKRNISLKDSKPEEGSSSSNKDSHNETVDDSIIQMLMTSAQVLSALNLGLDVSRIKQVLRDRLMQRRLAFNSLDELIAEVMDSQFNEPIADLRDDDQSQHNYNSPIELINRIINYRYDPVHPSSESEECSSEEEDTIITESDLNQQMSEFSNQNLKHEVNIEHRNLSLIECASPNNQDSILFSSNDNQKLKKNCVLDEFNQKSKSIDAQILEEENRKLKEAKLCKICMDQDLNIVFLPCGHLISCSKCAANLKECPLCRQMIKGTVRTFLA